MNTTPPATWTADMTLARIRLEQWSVERAAIRQGRIKDYTRTPGRAPRSENSNRYDAVLVRCIDFERELSKLPGDTQTLLLLAYRERQPQRIIAQLTNISPRALAYKIPAALAQLANLLDRASLL